MTKTYVLRMTESPFSFLEKLEAALPYWKNSPMKAQRFNSKSEALLLQTQIPIKTEIVNMLGVSKGEVGFLSLNND